jgi:GNAT superfamily N-acetyltransferase
MEFAGVRGQRVALRDCGVEDGAAIDLWIDEAVTAAGNPHRLPLSRGAGEGGSVGAGKSGVLVIERVGETGPVGFLEYQIAGGWLTVAFIAVAKASRRWGYGSEAVRLLEEWAVHERLAKRFLAEVPVGNGLGLYFWLRLGYRPAGAGEFDWPSDNARDMMPMVRIAG